jgi:hypothetical protein
VEHHLGVGSAGGMLYINMPRHLNQVYRPIVFLVAHVSADHQAEVPCVFVPLFYGLGEPIKGLNQVHVDSATLGVNHSRCKLGIYIARERMFEHVCNRFQIIAQ